MCLPQKVSHTHLDDNHQNTVYNYKVQQNRRLNKHSLWLTFLRHWKTCRGILPKFDRSFHTRLTLLLPVYTTERINVICGVCANWLKVQKQYGVIETPPHIHSQPHINIQCSLGVHSIWQEASLSACQSPTSDWIVVRRNAFSRFAQTSNVQPPGMMQLPRSSWRLYSFPIEDCP